MIVIFFPPWRRKAADYAFRHVPCRSGRQSRLGLTWHEERCCACMLRPEGGSGSTACMHQAGLRQGSPGATLSLVMGLHVPCRRRSAALQGHSPSRGSGEGRNVCLPGRNAARAWIGPVQARNGCAFRFPPEQAQAVLPLPLGRFLKGSLDLPRASPARQPHLGLKDRGEAP